MTAAELRNLSAELDKDLAVVAGVTERVLLRGIVAAAEAFDVMAPLPPLKQHPRERLWEPAAVRYRDLPTTEKEAI